MNKIITHLKYNWIVIKNRYRAESPAIFKALKKLAYKVGGSCLAIITANTALALGLPAIVITVLSWIVALCIGIAGTAKLTKE